MQTKETMIQNILKIVLIEFILLPIGIFIFLTMGFHIYHLFLILCYVYGLVLVFETVKIFKDELYLKLAHKYDDTDIDDYYEDSDELEDKEELEETPSYREKAELEEENNDDELSPEFKDNLRKVFEIEKRGLK